MDGRTDGQTDRQTGGRTDGHVTPLCEVVMTVKDSENISESSKKSYMYMYGLACVHLWTDGRTEGRTDKQTDRRTDGWRDGRTCSDIVLSRRDRKKF